MSPLMKIACTKRIDMKITDGLTGTGEIFSHHVLKEMKWRIFYGSI